jgi:hypothetical protein
MAVDLRKRTCQREDGRDQKKKEMGFVGRLRERLIQELMNNIDVLIFYT